MDSVRHIFFSKENVQGDSCKAMMDTIVGSNMKLIRPCIEKLGYNTGDERADHFYVLYI